MGPARPPRHQAAPGGAEVTRLRWPALAAHSQGSQQFPRGGDGVLRRGRVKAAVASRRGEAAAGVGFGGGGAARPGPLGSLRRVRRDPGGSERAGAGAACGHTEVCASLFVLLTVCCAAL